jgi:hypothetical protein
MNVDPVREYLDVFQSEMATGFQECDHKYFSNGTISCVKCGKTTNPTLSKWDLMK